MIVDIVPCFSLGKSDVKHKSQAKTLTEDQKLWLLIQKIHRRTRWDLYTLTILIRIGFDKVNKYVSLMPNIILGRRIDC